MRVPYTCNPRLYTAHYDQQVGGQSPYFSGHLTQSGYGLGNFLGGLARKALPFLRKTAVPLLKSTAKELFKTGNEVLGDVLSSEKGFEESLRDRGKKRLFDIHRKVSEIVDEDRPSPSKRPKREIPLKSKAIPVKRRRKKHRRDVFD